MDQEEKVGKERENGYHGSKNLKVKIAKKRGN